MHLGDSAKKMKLKAINKHSTKPKIWSVKVPNIPCLNHSEYKKIKNGYRTNKIVLFENGHR